MNPNIDGPILNKKQLSKLTPEQLAKFKALAPDEWKSIEAEKHVNKWLAKFICDEHAYPVLADLKRDVRLLAEVDDPVLIQGETGTGKELLANALHGERGEDLPTRGAGKFIAINCAGIPETLVESALFGHKAGAFTGAAKGDRAGVFQAAWNGTVFLDEIGELSMSVQAKLLRALQEKVISKVGAEDQEPEKINCRFVAATHKDLQYLIKIGQFREDLYYRISTFQLNTLPLRERSADVPLIVKHLIIKDKGANKYEIDDIEEFCKPILEELAKPRLPFPGNVRQLEQIVRRFHVLGKMPEFDNEKIKLLI